MAFPGDGDTINSRNSGDRSLGASPGIGTAGALTSVISCNSPNDLCCPLLASRGVKHVAQCHTVCPGQEPVPHPPPPSPCAVPPPQ